MSIWRRHAFGAVQEHANISRQQHNLVAVGSGTHISAVWAPYRQLKRRRRFPVQESKQSRKSREERLLSRGSRSPTPEEEAREQNAVRDYLKSHLRGSRRSHARGPGLLGLAVSPRGGLFGLDHSGPQPLKRLIRSRGRLMRWQARLLASPISTWRLSAEESK
ncbi:hypothetical protein ACLOJK_026622 [Asimina triloba]